MRTLFINIHAAVSVMLAGFSGAAWAAKSPADAATNEVVPLIEISAVPLSDAIRNLATHAGFNYILDPRLTSTVMGSDGKRVAEPVVTSRWQNMTAKQALAEVLAQHKLVMVESPDTSVTRITDAQGAAKPAVHTGLGVDTNALIAQIVMDGVPLNDAIRNLAAAAHINILLDPKLLEPSSNGAGKRAHPPDVSIRWRNLTAKQALAALLENYDLVMVRNAATGVTRITRR